MSRLLLSMSKVMLNVNAASGEIRKPNGTMDLIRLSPRHVQGAPKLKLCTILEMKK